MPFNTLAEMIQLFDSEEKCLHYLASLRWPDGTVCPHCGGVERINRLQSRPLWWCGDCKRQFSLRIGTIFEGSPIEMKKWLIAIWLLTDHDQGQGKGESKGNDQGKDHGQSKDQGITSDELAQAIGVTQKTVGFMLGRLREVMPVLPPITPPVLPPITPIKT